MTCLLGKIDLHLTSGDQSKHKSLQTPSVVNREKQNFSPEAIHLILKKGQRLFISTCLVEIFI